MRYPPDMPADWREGAPGRLGASEIPPSEALRRVASRLPRPVCLHDGRSGGVLVSAGPDEEISVAAPGDPFDALGLIAQSSKPAAAAVEGDPGWIGALTYEAGRAVERLPQRVREHPLPPRLRLARYRAAYWWHPLTGARLGGDTACSRRLAEALEDPLDEEELSSLSGEPVGRPRLEMDRGSYEQAFHEIAAAIREGEVYQVNLTSPVLGGWSGSPIVFHESLVAGEPPPWAAYVDMGEVIFSSASPELLLAFDARTRRAVSAPIKGTAPRYADPARDEASRRALLASTKDRAEHVMIVDLVRNDLGRVCRPGSVRAEPLMAPMKLSRVHHLVTEVHGTVSDEVSIATLLKAVYPGGSVTGAPKVSAMTFIDRLEASARGVYCGALGRISPSGDMALALPIRTATLRAEGARRFEVSYGAGGGLVADSRPEEEHSELLLKAGRVMEVLGGA